MNALKDSVRQIQKGNLNVVLQTKTKDEVGELTGAFNDMAAELRELRRGERAKLIRTEHSTQSVIDSLPDAVAILNVYGTVELSNTAARELFGLFPEVSVPSRKDDLLRQLFFSALLMDQPSDQLGISNALQVFKNGDEHFYLPHAIPIKGETNSVIGVTLVLADVTRLRRVTELEIEPIAVVSHELKTSLTSMRMAIHMLLGRPDRRFEFATGGAADERPRGQRTAEPNYREPAGYQPNGSGEDQIESGTESPGEIGYAGSGRVLSSYRNAGVELVSQVPDDIPDVTADPVRIALVFSNSALRMP